MNTPEPETVQIKELKPHPRNYRTHPDAQVAHIGRSLEQHGQYRNVVIAKDSTILAGHGVVQAAEKIAWTDISAIRLDLDADSPQALKLLASDNELGRFAEIDDRELTEILQEVKELDEFGLDGTGFDDMMLANLLYVTRGHDEIEDVDHAAEWLGMPDYEPKVADRKYMVIFRNTADRENFALKMGLKVGKTERRAWSTWWPEKEQDDVKSVIFEG